MSEIKPGDRLPPAILALIAHVTKSLGAASVTLVRQGKAATVVRHSATMLDLEVSTEAELVDLADGPTPTQALVYDGEDLVGELLVWVRSGQLIGIEQAWFTDEAPTEWPSPDAVRVS